MIQAARGWVLRRGWQAAARLTPAGICRCGTRTRRTRCHFAYGNGCDLETDNNLAENAIRPFALGREDWLFAATPNGAEAGAMHYSIIATAKPTATIHIIISLTFLRSFPRPRPSTRLNDCCRGILTRKVYAQRNGCVHDDALSSWWKSESLQVTTMQRKVTASPRGGVGSNWKRKDSP